jgi:hypothetical protein
VQRGNGRRFPVAVSGYDALAVLMLMFSKEAVGNNDAWPKNYDQETKRAP